MNTHNMSEGVQRVALKLEVLSDHTPMFETVITPVDYDISNLSRNDWLTISELVKTGDVHILGYPLSLRTEGGGRFRYCLLTYEMGGIAVHGKADSIRIDDRVEIGSLRIPYKAEE